MPLGLGGHVLAAAEADLEPDLAGAGGQGRGSTGPSGMAIFGSRVSSSAAWRGLIGRALIRP